MRQLLELPLTPPAAPAWPDWLEACRIDDAALAEAYDHVSMPHRASLKQCMAFCQAVYGVAAEEQLCARADSGQGFWRSERSAPAPWTLAVITPEYDAPARLTAALMPAVLARVPRVALLCADGMPQQNIRTVLELTGVEDSFITTAGQAEDLIRTLAAASAGSGAGRLLLLHHGALHPLRALAAELDIPCMEEAVPPCLGLLAAADPSMAAAHTATAAEAVPAAPASPQLHSTVGHNEHPHGTGVTLTTLAEAADIDLDALAFAHGAAGAHPHPVFCGGKPPRLDACLAAEHALAEAARLARLALGPGMEACWLHSALTRNFFRNTSMTAGLCLPDTDFFSGGGYEGAD